MKALRIFPVLFSLWVSLLFVEGVAHSSAFLNRSIRMPAFGYDKENLEWMVEKGDDEHQLWPVTSCRS